MTTARIPVWLRPWLIPMILVVGVVLLAITPGFIGFAVLAVAVFVVLARILWVTRHWDFYELSRTDRFFRGVTFGAPPPERPRQDPR